MGKNLKAGSVFVVLKAKYAEMSAGIGKGMKDLNSKVKSGLAKAKAATARFAAGVKKQLTSGFTLGSSVVAGGMIAVMTVLGKKAVGVAGDFEQTKVAYETMLGSASKADAVLKSLTKFSTVTPFEPDQVYKAGKQLLAFGVPAKALIPTLRKIGDLAAGTGKDFNELASVFGKIKTKGKAQAEELNQLAEAGIPIIQELAAMYGVGAEEVYKMGAEGKIAFDDIEEAFGRMTGEGGRFNNMMEKQSETFNGIMSTLKGNIAEAGKAIAEHWLPNLKAAAMWLNDYAKTLSEIKGAQETINKTDISGRHTASGNLTDGLYNNTMALLNGVTFGHANSIVAGMADVQGGKEMINVRTTSEERAAARLELIRKWKAQGRDTSVLEAGASGRTQSALIDDAKQASAAKAAAEKSKAMKNDESVLDDVYKEIDKKEAETAKLAEAVAVMKEKLRLQKLMNEGKGKEVAISKAIADAERRSGRALSDNEKNTVSDLAGDLYDSTHKKKKKGKELSAAIAKTDVAGSFYANLAGLSAGPAADRTAKATESIVKNTKETNKLLKKSKLVYG